MSLGKITLFDIHNNSLVEQNVPTVTTFDVFAFLTTNRLKCLRHLEFSIWETKKSDVKVSPTSQLIRWT